MTRRYLVGTVVRSWIVVTLALITLSVVVATAQSSPSVRVGILSAGPAPAPGTQSPLREALLRGLRELGWIEGQNLKIESRYAAWKLESLPELAAELVA